MFIQKLETALHSPDLRKNLINQLHTNHEEAYLGTLDSEKKWK